MKTKRAYYTCPILAALASEYHGARFADKDGKKLEIDITDSGLTWYRGLRKYQDEVWFYRQESMRLLEPTLEDLWIKPPKGIYLLGAWFIGREDSLSEFRDLKENNPGEFARFKLEMRNNMPFPWPEFEDLNLSNSTPLEKEVGHV